MAWYRTGTVAVTNGSATVTGSGTAFVGAVLPGYGFVGPDGRSYEVLSVKSATSLTLAASYLGSTQSGAGYAIFPTYGQLASFNTQLAALISGMQGVQDNAGQGKFGDGSPAAPGIRFVADGDTGIDRPAANQLGLVTGGSRRALLSNAALQLDVPLTGTSAQGLGALYCARAGTANTITLSYGVGALTAGIAVRFRASAANTASASINLDGKGAKTCKTPTGVSLPAGYIRTDVDTTATYDGTNWIVDRQIERGSNVNGEYTRLADGTQICWNTVVLGSITTVGSGTFGDPYRTNLATWYYPAAFNNTSYSVSGVVRPDPVASFGLRSINTMSGQIGRYADRLSNFNAVRGTDNSSADEMIALLIAAGSWY